jgi:hypothetical protein
MAYTIEEVADAHGVTIATVRNWIKAGLHAMTAQRPYLILGSALKSFHKQRKIARRTPLKVDEFYCLSCRSGRKPDGMLADFVPHSPTTGRLVGLCSSCGGVCNRMVGRRDLQRLEHIFDISIKEGSDA